jgi:uncharacterized protein (DUF58 family)
MILPTRRAIFLLATGAPLGLAAIAMNVTLWNYAALWLIVVVALLIIDALSIMPPHLISVKAKAPPLLYIGESDPLQLTVQLLKAGKSQLLTVSPWVNDLVQRLAPAQVQITDSAQDIVLPITPLGRGEAKLDGLEWRWLGPLGLMARQHIISLNAIMPVVPNTRAVAREAPKMSLDDAMIGLKQQRRKGEGSEFEALRDFGMGMDRRTIDWKHSARHGKLLAKEYDTERNHQVIFAFDCGQLMGEPIAAQANAAHPLSRLDVSINSALMLAHICLRAGDRIGLFAFDALVRRRLDPVGGSTAFGLFAHQAGRVEQQAFESNYTLGLTTLGGTLERRSLIILFSEFVDTTTAELMIDHLGRLAKRHLILFVCFNDPELSAIGDQPLKSRSDLAASVVANDMVQERRIVLERLKRAGLMVIETQAGALTPQLLERYIEIKQRELI